MKKTISRLILLALSAAAALAGWLWLGRAAVQQTQPNVTELLPLNPQYEVAQTFVARLPGLRAIHVYLLPETEQGEIQLHLAHSLVDSYRQGTATVGLAGLAGGFVRFELPVQRDSNQQEYVFSLQATSGAQAAVGRGPGGSYADGAAYQNAVALDNQVAFWLEYDPAALLLGLIPEFTRWAGWLLLAAWLYLLPGWGWLAWLWPDWDELGLPEKIGLAGGVSLALAVVWILWSSWLNWRSGALTVWLLPLAGLGLWMLRQSEGLRARRLFERRAWRWPRLEPALLLYLWLALLLVFSRLWAGRSLEAPLWGDSVQHAVMTQRIVEEGGLFQSWQPYTPFETLTVQFGFSALAALWAWASGQTAAQATIWAGQWLNILAILGLYPLARWVFRDQKWADWAAALTLLAAGLLAPTPGIYVNWGRYAQLSGQAMLPAALWLLWAGFLARPHLVKLPSLRLAGMALTAAIALAGATLGYYRHGLYYAAFAVAWLLVFSLPGSVRFVRQLWQKPLRALWPLFWSSAWLLATALLAALLLGPWVGNVLGGQLSEAVGAGVTRGGRWERILSDYQAWLSLFEFWPAPLAWASGLGLAWALLRRRWDTVFIGVWALLLAGLLALSLLRLPGANMMQSFAVVISFYLPGAILAAGLVEPLARLTEALALKPRWRALPESLSVLALAALALWGGWQQSQMARPLEYGMVQRPDMQAMVWIRQAMPAEARFLVQGYTIQAGASMVGADAGWWLPLLAGRENTMPPQYALMNERPTDSAQIEGQLALVRLLETTALSEPAALAALCQAGVTHVYSGQGQGMMGHAPLQLFTPQEMLGQPAYQLLYLRDRVWIFAFDRSLCGP